MQKINFYILESKEPKAYFQFVCKLSEKLYKLGMSIHIHSKDKGIIGELDQWLWNFKVESFLPHRVLQKEHASKAKPKDILISSELSALPEADTLINLSKQPPECLEKYQRLVEVIPNTPSALKAARLRYKHYQNSGFLIKIHDFSKQPEHS